MTTSAELHAQLAIKQSVDVGREEFLDYMTFRRNTRPLFDELFGPIVGLKEEWAAQGASPEELDMSAFPYRRAGEAYVRVSTGWVGGPAPRVLEETAEHIIELDHYGRRVRLMKGVATLPLPMDYPVRTMDDWLKIKHHYAFSEERFAPGWPEAARKAGEAGYVICLGIPGGFGEPRQLLGDEGVCVAFYEQPELIHDILRTIGDTACRVVERVTAQVQVDMLSTSEDLAGKSGPLAGPRQVREFIGPYYRRVWDLVRAGGGRLFGQDSDGNLNAVIEPFIEAGLNVMHPMDPRPGWISSRSARSTGRDLRLWAGSTSTSCGGAGKRSRRSWSTKFRPWSGPAAASCRWTIASRTARPSPTTGSTFRRHGRS